MRTYTIVGSLILATSVFVPTPASAVDARVEVGCASDYMAYCSHTTPTARASAVACAPTNASCRELVSTPWLPSVRCQRTRSREPRDVKFNAARAV